jgi:hypothetical protein
MNYEDSTPRTGKKVECLVHPAPALFDHAYSSLARHWQPLHFARPGVQCHLDRWELGTDENSDWLRGCRRPVWFRQKLLILLLAASTVPIMSASRYTTGVQGL